MKKKSSMQEETATGMGDPQELLHSGGGKQRLQVAAEMQMAILNALPAQIALLDTEGVILAVNEAWRCFATANALQGDDFYVGQNYLTVCEDAHGDCAEEAQAAADGIRSVLSGKQVEFSLEYPCHSPGEKRWFRVIATPLSEQRMAGAVVMHLNITERKLAAEEARSAGERMLETLESITDGFCTIDREWRFTYLNAEAERLLGRDRATLLGRNIWEAYPPAVGTVFEREYRRAMEENRTITFEEYYPPLDMWIEVKAYPSAGALAVYFRDVSERRRTLAALEASESKFRQFADSNILGIMIWDADGNIHDANGAFLQMLGYTRGELETGGFDWRSLTPAEFSAADTRALEEIAAMGRCTPFEKEYFHKDGHRVAVMLGAAAMDGEKGGGIGYVVDVSAQKESEAKVRASEASLVHAQSIARIGNWDWDIGTDEVYWSEQARHLYGSEPTGGKVDYQTFLKCVHPDDREWVNEAVQASVAGVPYNIKHRVLCPDGTVRWVHERGEVLRDAAGVALSMTGTVQDITESRRAEEALRVSEERFRLMIEGSEQMIFYTHDRENIFEYVSPSVLAVLGYEPAELIGQPFQSVLFPDDPANDEVNELTEKAMQDGRPGDAYLAMVRHKDGRRIVMEIVEGPMLDDGRSTGMQGFARDITERETARSAVAASEEEFRNLAESMPQIVWVTRPDGWNIYINRHWVDYTGLSLDESLGHGWNKPFHPDDRQRAWDSWQVAVTTACPHAIECRLRRADGEYRWWLIRGEPQRDTAGQVIKWFGTCTDIHDLKNAEMEITRTNRALKLLSGCNAALIHGEDEKALLRNICRLAVDTGGYRMAWVGYAMDDAKHSIRPMAHAGVEDGYLDEIDITWDEESLSGQGPGGQAIRSGKAVICGDMAEDSEFHWLDAAQRRGYRAVISLPLRDKQRTFGLLGLYSADSIVTNVEEQRLLQEMTDDLAFGILNIRDRHARQRTQTALVNVASAVSTATGREFFEQLAGKMAEALGAQAGFVAELVPGQPLKARTIVAIVDGQPADNFEYVLEGTPCEILVTSESCVITEELAQRFPLSPCLVALGAQSYVGRRLDSSTGKFLGLLFVLFREPLREPDLVVAMMQIFAARAAAELERQKTDARLREQAALLDKAQDAILVRDLDHTILYWNHSAERLYGWSAAEAVGRSERDLIYRKHDVFDSACETLLSCGEWVGEIEQVTKAGTAVTVEGHWSLVSAEQGNARSILAINTDITERKKIEAQYLRAQRMESIGTLAGGIAHDLNNVLAPITMAIDLLKMEEKNTERLGILSIIEGCAKRGADMVRQVLSFARGVEGQQTEVRVGELIEEIQKVVHDTFPKNIELRGDIAPDLWLVRGDPTQLHQVLINLCVNARDAMPDGGTLTLTAGNLILDEQYTGMNIEAKPGHHVCIHVEDTGEGLPPDVMERIFEPFYTTKEIGKGTGLGLSTSIAIIKSHGGFIRVYSEVGMGTRFHVYLPAYIGTDIAEHDAVFVELPRGKGELVLVVDDEAAVREITRQTLETFGYRVLLATDGVDATSIYAERRQEIAIVLTDMMMPLMDGPTMIKVLLKLNPEVRIIAASGLNVNAMVAKAHSAGIKHFIPKPYTAETLLKTLREALEG